MLAALLHKLIRPLLLICCGFCLHAVFGRQMKSGQEPKDPLPDWELNRYIDCTFCIDYDDFKRLSIFGCRFKQTPSCRGNVCYMRQHKNQSYFLFTSGCLNLTETQYRELRYITNKAVPDRESSNATQLCEVSSINTCLCTNGPKCNNVSKHDPFTEYVMPIFRDTDFDEVSHFKYFLPNDPVLEIVGQNSRNERDEYFLIKSHTNQATAIESSNTSIFAPLLILVFLNLSFIRDTFCI